MYVINFNVPNSQFFTLGKIKLERILIVSEMNTHIVYLFINIIFIIADFLQSVIVHIILKGLFYDA